jgi:hypothetical protein
MSKLEVDAIEPQSGTTLTIGASGDSVNIASGATITDFTSTGIDDNATSTAITIDSSENVGIGTTNPDSMLHIETVSGTAQIKLRKTVSGTSIIKVEDSGFLNINNASNAGMLFGTNDTERMRIDSSGTVLVNATSSVGTGKFQASLSTTGFCSTMSSPGNQADYIQFWNGSEVGSIKRSGGAAVSYNTSSDYRLKENVSYDFDATTRLKQLKPARFNFIGETDRTVDGFLAHEVSSIVPEAISGTKDATETKEKVVVNANGNVIAENIEQADWEAGKIADEEGNTQYPTDSTWEATKVVPVYQGIDQSKLVPLLVKTIQELEARITALENK